MQCNDERGKIFVGGLSWDTTHGSMLKYFAQYGEVIDCVVMKNPLTGKSRGFGFVTFKEPICVDHVLADGLHILDGREIDPKSCNPRSMNKGGKNLENSHKKIFVGGLPVNITEEVLREHFSAYGPVSEVIIMYDQQKNKSRGFGFLTFESEESVDRVIQEHYVQVNGKQVEVKRAEPRDTKSLIGGTPVGSGSDSADSFVDPSQSRCNPGPNASNKQLAIARATSTMPSANHSLGLPPTYSTVPLAANFCQNSATLVNDIVCRPIFFVVDDASVGQCFPHSYVIGSTYGDTCLPPVGPSLYSPSWIRCCPDPLVTGIGQQDMFSVNGGMGVTSSQQHLAPPIYNVGASGLGAVYAVMNGHCFDGLAYGDAAQFGMLDPRDPEILNKNQTIATTSYRFAFGDYGNMGFCSTITEGSASTYGGGDSVQLEFIDPSVISQGRITTYHSLASQGVHPYKR